MNTHSVRMLELASLMGTWCECGQSCVMLNSDGVIKFMRPGSKCLQELMRDFPSLKGCDVYTNIVPSPAEINELYEIFGVNSIQSVNSIENHRKNICKQYAKELIKKNESSYHDISVDEEISDIMESEGIEAHRMGVFYDEVELKYRVIACNVDDSMEYAPGFQFWLGDECLLKKKDDVSLMESKLFDCRQLGNMFTLKYRVGMVRTQFNSVQLVLVTNANQHQSVSDSSYFIKWLRDWTE